MNTSNPESEMWGIAMEPCVEPIKQELTRLVVSNFGSPCFRYLEIGIAEGLTMAGVGRHLANMLGDFELYGVDIANGWSLDFRNLMDNLRPFIFRTCVSLGGSQEFLKQQPDDMFDFILVDGCHGEACVTADIVALYPKLKKGGIACFHDSDDAAQGMDVQPHCNQPIQVRSALTKAGILDGSNKDWKLLHDINNVTVGRGCVMVEKL